LAKTTADSSRKDHIDPGKHVKPDVEKIKEAIGGITHASLCEEAKSHLSQLERLLLRKKDSNTKRPNQSVQFMTVVKFIDALQRLKQCDPPLMPEDFIVEVCRSKRERRVAPMAQLTADSTITESNSSLEDALKRTRAEEIPRESESEQKRTIDLEGKDESKQPIEILTSNIPFEQAWLETKADPNHGFDGRVLSPSFSRRETMLLLRVSITLIGTIVALALAFGYPFALFHAQSKTSSLPIAKEVDSNPIIGQFEPSLKSKNEEIVQLKRVQDIYSLDFENAHKRFRQVKSLFTNVLDPSISTSSLPEGIDRLLLEIRLSVGAGQPLSIYIDDSPIRFGRQVPQAIRVKVIGNAHGEFYLLFIGNPASETGKSQLRIVRETDVNSKRFDFPTSALDASSTISIVVFRIHPSGSVASTLDLAFEFEDVQL
jgi:hypothetical protein